jgi:hypothetical protein
MMSWPAHAENVAIVAALCFLVWVTGSAWWALLLLLINYPKGSA